MIENEAQKESLISFGCTWQGRFVLALLFVVEIIGLYTLDSGGSDHQIFRTLLLLVIASLVAQAKRPALKGIFLSVGCALFFAPNLHLSFSDVAFLENPLLSSFGSFFPLSSTGSHFVVLSFALSILVGSLLSLAAIVLILAKKVGKKGFFAHFVRNTFLLIGALGVASCLPRLPDWAVKAFIIPALFCASLIWFLAYAVHDRTSYKPPTLFQSLAFMPAFWGGIWRPNGKGWNYNSKFLARSQKELVESQFSSVKIIFGLIFLDFIYLSLAKGEAFLHLTTQFQDVMKFAHGQVMSRSASWEILTFHFFKEMLEMAIWGNLIVAIAHFSGFRIPKNTIAPLLSRSLADFWNRYNFYFKELLVDFFFIPTFRKLMDIPEKWRVFIATMAAAGLGNYLCHLIKAIIKLPEYGIVPYLIASSTYAFYCLVLALGIGISQLLTPHGYLEKKFRFHICVSVLAFFALIKIFDYSPMTVIEQTNGHIVSVWVFLKYFVYLFGGSFYA